MLPGVAANVSGPIALYRYSSTAVCRHCRAWSASEHRIEAPRIWVDCNPNAYKVHESWRQYRQQCTTPATATRRGSETRSHRCGERSAKQTSGSSLCRNAAQSTSISYCSRCPLHPRPASLQASAFAPDACVRFGAGYRYRRTSLCS